MDATERALLERTLREVITEADSIVTTDQVLIDLGWLEMLNDEPRHAIHFVFEALGNTDRVSTSLDDVFTFALGTKPRPGISALLPQFASWEPPGRLTGDRVQALGLSTPRAVVADEIFIVCDTTTGLCGVTVPTRAAQLRAVHGIDPDAGLHVVSVDCRPELRVPLDGSAWESALTLGRRAVAHQMAGASRAMLELARAHALEREQFGRPVARFQAVRHHLADTLVAIEVLDAALGAAGDESNFETAALAKAVAGRTASTVASHCQQVLAGIGFTTAHSFHRFLKRTITLEGIFGSSDNIAIDIGQRLLARRAVPTLIEL